MTKYTDKQLIQVIDTLIKNNTEYPNEDFTGGSIGVTLVNNATLLKYKFTMYFGFKNKNAISKVIEVDKNIYNILVDALEVKTKSLLDSSNKLSLNDIETILTTGSKVGINTKGTTSTKTNTNTINTNTINTNTNESKKQNTLEILNPLINEESYNEWVAFKKIKVKGTITKLINFLIEYDKPTQKQIIDNSIMNNYKGLFPPKNTLATKQKPVKTAEKTLDEVLNIYIHQRKIHTNKDYTFAKCKEMLHWNLHKEFTKLSTSFEEEMMLAYGYDWVNGKIDFNEDGNDENIIELESK